MKRPKETKASTFGEYGTCSRCDGYCNCVYVDDSNIGSTLILGVAVGLIPWLIGGNITKTPPEPPAQEQSR